jgi:hypothetical protein
MGVGVLQLPARDPLDHRLRHAAEMTRRAASGALYTLALAGALAPIPSWAVERWYSQDIYPSLQRILTTASNSVPFALFDILWVAAAAVCATASYRRIRTDGWRRGPLRLAVMAARAIAAVYIIFLATWGLNYRRVPLIERLAFDPQRVTRTAAGRLGETNAATLNTLYAAAHQTPEPLSSLDAAFQDAVRGLGATRPVVPGRPKPTLLGGYFHETSVAGMTDPFLLETLIAPDLLDVERPFVIAHEWAHLAGYADESEANFIAWLTCRRAGPAARYSAALALIGYAGPRRPLNQALDIGPRIDIYAIGYRYARTNETLRFAARQGYDKYLKANRVERGVESYDAVVQLILGSELDRAGNPRFR